MAMISRASVVALVFSDVRRGKVPSTRREPPLTADSGRRGHLDLDRAHLRFAAEDLVGSLGEVLDPVQPPGQAWLAGELRRPERLVFLEADLAGDWLGEPEDEDERTAVGTHALPDQLGLERRRLAARQRDLDGEERRLLAGPEEVADVDQDRANGRLAA
jgi:hypothetical protein